MERYYIFMIRNTQYYTDVTPSQINLLIHLQPKFIFFHKI